MWVLVRPRRFEGAKYASDHDTRSRYREIGLSGSWRRCGWQCRHTSSAQAALRAGIFQKLPPCLVSIEACASSHHWSRELQALGHTVRLMPPAYVKPYVKRHKNDATDAEAICEAVTRPNMRFVATKAPEQQSCLTLHRTRHLFIRQQTSVINAIRAHLAEFGIVAPIGRLGVEQLLGVVSDASDKRLPDVARACVATSSSTSC